jgi:hypothetical protein
MIVFLDANVLMQDPTCSGTVWHVLAHAPDAWGLRLVTSEVAIAEAVGGYGRRVSAEVAKVEKLTRSWGALGAAEEAVSFLELLRKKRAAYQDHLQSSLRAAGVEVLNAPDVSHMEIVSRSVARRRPCDDKGDGYRDTLIWLSVLFVASENPEEDVVFVTEDTDFMDDDQQGFHGDLLEDLSEIGAYARVSMSKVLADVALELAEGSSDNADLRSLRSDLKDETVQRFVNTLASELPNRQVDSRGCALPRLTRANFLQDVGSIENFKYTIKGGLPQNEAVAEFSFEAVTRIVLTLPEGVMPDKYEATIPVHAEGSVLYVITKPLIYSGIVRLGRYDRPLGGEITKISARLDDPAHREWRIGGFNVNADALAHIMRDVNMSPLRDIMKNVRPTTATNEGASAAEPDIKEGNRTDPEAQEDEGGGPDDSAPLT